LRDVTQRIIVVAYRRFGVVYRFHLHGSRGLQRIIVVAYRRFGVVYRFHLHGSRGLLGAA